MNEHIEIQPTCFACGSEHPQGLGLRFHTEQQGVVTAESVPDTRWEGFRGIVHGGIVSTVLDEAMSKAVASTGTPGLTCRLEVRLSQSVAPSESLRIRAWVTERRKRGCESKQNFAITTMLRKRTPVRPSSPLTTAVSRIRELT